ncbi:hypothetical protein PV08_05772 [Exophiala spinifera]|uniref:Velvet domain-containing protein n=1 Tax=Exophiala spinifera TaxID=91928 RepID=A0A0D1ZSC1_9EURO|nr:uncharacterized protein PV08_05772 [Exophiala spinifera]KIW15722.1 hypothetical protein PV08_05772 [Exophiala spinifera]
MASSSRPAEAISPLNTGGYFQQFEDPWSGHGVLEQEAPSRPASTREFNTSSCSLVILQEPRLWRASNAASPTIGNGKAGKKSSVKKDTNNFLEPPVALEWARNGHAVVDPHVMCVVTVKSLDPENPVRIDTLIGCTTSSLQKLKHAQGDQSIFAFPTLGIRYPGRFVLIFSVYRVHEGVFLDEATGGRLRLPYTEMIAEIYGSELIISTEKNAAYSKLSTQFTKNMRESGVKVRTRKEPRKRKSATTNWTADVLGAKIPGSFPFSPTYMALPGHSGPMPNLHNGEDISRRISYQGMTSSASLHTQTQYTAATPYLLPATQQQGYWTQPNAFMQTPAAYNTGVYQGGVHHDSVNPAGVYQSSVNLAGVYHGSVDPTGVYHSSINPTGSNHGGVIPSGGYHGSVNPTSVSHGSISSTNAHHNGVNHIGLNHNGINQGDINHSGADDNDAGSNDINNYHPGWSS